MGYDPNDQTVSFRQVLAGWILCLAMAALAFAVTGQHDGMSATNAGDPAYATTAACCPPSGVRLPYFAPCAAEPREAARTARGPMSLPANPCG